MRRNYKVFLLAQKHIIVRQYNNYSIIHKKPSKNNNNNNTIF